MHTHRSTHRRGPSRSAGLAASIGTAVLALIAPAAARADAAIPYTDTAKAGSITLCDRAGQAVTSGAVDATPFVWSVHTDMPAPDGYGVKGGTATLFAFQPRQGVPPAYWSGLGLTASSTYDDPTHPTVQLTGADSPLSQMTSSYPPQWDGLLELRVFLGAPDSPSYKTTYAALTVKVSDDGTTWQALDPGTTPCSTGKAVSETTKLGLPTTPAGTQAVAPAVGLVSSSASGSAPRSGGATAPSAAGAPAATSAAAASVATDEPTVDIAAPAASTTQTSHGTSLLPIVLAAIGGALAVLAVGAVLRRRRSPQ